MHVKIKITSEKTFNISDQKMEKQIVNLSEGEADELMKMLRVCIVDEHKFKIRRFHVLLASSVLILIATAITLAVIFVPQPSPGDGPEGYKSNNKKVESNIIKIWPQNNEPQDNNNRTVTDFILQSEQIRNPSTDIHSNTIRPYEYTVLNRFDKVIKSSEKKTSVGTKRPLSSAPTSKPSKIANKGILRIVKRAEWFAENSTETIPKLKMLPAPYVIIAHTVTSECNTTDSCKSAVRNIQAFHLSLEYGDISYNFLVGGDGNVYEGRGWDKHGAHTIPFNSRSIGLAFIGDFRFKSPPRKQIVAAQLLLEEGVIQKKLTANYKVFGHKQVVATESPGAKLMAIIENTWPHWSPYNPAVDG